MNYEKHLLKDRRFWPIFWTQFLGAFNDNVFKNALVILIAYKAYTILGLSPEQMVVLCGGLFILPFFLFSAIAGQISDKYPKHRLIFYIKIAEVIIMLVGALGFFGEHITILLVSLFLMGLQSTFFGPAKYSILPELINNDELVHGNALVEMGTFVSILLGTILGGTLIAMPEVGRVYVAVSVIFFAFLGTLTSYRIQSLKASSPDLKLSLSFFKTNWEIIKITKEIKSVYLSILGISWFWFVGAALLSIFPLYVKDVLNGDEGIVTLFLAIFSIGVAVGSFICEKLSREHLELGLVPFGSIGMTLFLMDVYFAGTPTFSSGQVMLTVSEFLNSFAAIRILMDLFLFSVFSGFFIVPLYTFIQQRSSEDKRSRVIAGNNIINALFMVLASVLLAVLFQIGGGARDVFLLMAILNIFVSLYIYTVIPEFLWRFICFVISRLIYRSDIQGIKNIPDQGPVLLICNHVSFIDWLIIAAAVKRPVRFVMHYTFMKIPVINFFFRGSKVIPIAGKNEDPIILEEAFDKIAIELERGEVVCIFPEGEITRNGRLNTYRSGVQKVVERTPVLVVPMYLHGFWGSFFSRRYGKAASQPMVIFKKLFRKITLNVLPPLTPQTLDLTKIQNETQVWLDQMGED